MDPRLPVEHIAPSEVRIGWTAGKGFISSAIRFFDYDKVGRRRKRSMINHVYLHFFFRGSPSLIWESHGKPGICVSPANHLYTAIEDGRVIRAIEQRLELDPLTRRGIWERSQHMHGDGYDFRQIAAYSMWSALAGKRAGSLLARMGNPDRWTCNEAVVAALGGTVPELPRKDQALTPANMFARMFGETSFEYIKRNPERWQTVD